jgi:hypothetical protein
MIRFYPKAPSIILRLCTRHPALLWSLLRHDPSILLRIVKGNVCIHFEGGECIHTENR